MTGDWERWSADAERYWTANASPLERWLRRRWYRVMLGLVVVALVLGLLSWA